MEVPQQNPKPSRSGFTPTATIIGVSLVCLIAAANLDAPAQWLTDNDNLLEAAFCYQLMTSINSLLGLNTYRLSNAYMHLASCYSRLGRLKEAAHSSLQARNVMAALPGDRTVALCVLDAQRADYLRKARDYAAAEPLLKSTVAVVEKSATANASAKAYILSILLDTYMAQHKYADAEKIALQLIPVDDQMELQENTPGYGGRERLVELYCKTDRKKQAEQAGTEAVNMSRLAKNALEEAGAHDALGRAKLSSGEVETARSEFDLAVRALGQRYGANDHRVALWRARYHQMLKDKNPFPE